MRQRIVNVTRESNVPVKTLPGLYELISGESDLATQIRPVQVEDVLGREPVEVDLETTAGVPEGRDRAGHRRRAARSAPSSAARSRASARSGSMLVDQGETALFEIERELVDERGFAACDPGARRLHRAARRCARSSTRYRPDGRLPRRRLQARAADGGEPARVGAQQRARDAGRWPRPRSSSAPSASCSISTDKAVNPKTVMGQSKALCEWIVEAYGAPRRRRDAVRRGALRQRARLVGQRDPDLPRARSRSGGPVTVTHPEMTRYFMTIPRRRRSSSRPARSAAAATSSCSTWASRCGSSTSPTQMIRLSGQGARARHRDRDRRRPAGREAARGALGRGRGRRPTSHPKIMRVRGRSSTRSGSRTSSPSSSGWCARARRSSVVSRLATMMRAPRLVARPVHKKARFRNRR